MFTNSFRIITHVKQDSQMNRTSSAYNYHQYVIQILQKTCRKQNKAAINYKSVSSKAFQSAVHFSIWLLSNNLSTLT